MWYLIYFESIWPTLLYFYDFFIINIGIMYIGLLLYLEYNIFYLMGYFFLEIFFIGIFLNLYQIDILVAFFWLSELTIIFIFMFFLISLNYTIVLNTLNNFLKNYFAIGFTFFFMYYFLMHLITEYNFFLFKTNIFDLWEQYYDSINNNILNDLFIFFLIYFFFNGYEFLLLMFLLLLSTILCVKFNNFIFQYKIFNEENNKLNLLFFENYFNFFFLRKQNLIKQMFSLPFTQLLFKK